MPLSFIGFSLTVFLQFLRYILRRMLSPLPFLALATALLLSFHGEVLAGGRDHIHIVGSSTVFPFTTVAAENFSYDTGMPAPVVEKTGTGSGMKAFCAGVGQSTPDIVNASRAMKQSEKDLCEKHGVTDITEIKIGYDGIVIAQNNQSPAFLITRQQLWQALSKNIYEGGEWIANPFRNWQEINADLPDQRIKIIGPPPTSGTRDAFVELVMEKGCEAYLQIQGLDDSQAVDAAQCGAIREDGRYIDAGENDNYIVRRLISDNELIGVFGFSFLDQNSDVLRGLIVEGHAPDFEEIARGDYPVSRSLYIYVKNAHIPIIDGLVDFVTSFVSDDAIGEDGYLVDKGLIPLSDAERIEMQQRIHNGLLTVN